MLKNGKTPAFRFRDTPFLARRNAGISRARNRFAISLHPKNPPIGESARSNPAHIKILDFWCKKISWNFLHTKTTFLLCPGNLRFPWLQCGVGRSRRIFAIWIFLLLLISCVQPTVSFDDVSFYVEIADSPEGWSRGLMFREYLPENRGLLFVFKDSEPRHFWMKNTLIPLDIIFLDENLSVINIETAVPCIDDPCAHYSSDAPAKYALEINAGLAERYKIREGEFLRK